MERSIGMIYILCGISIFTVLSLTILYYFSFARVEYDYEINLNVSSDSFENYGFIPERYTGRGEDISPSLKIDKVIAEAKSIAIIMDDPDTPIGTFTHWVVWNIPANISYIPEGLPKEKSIALLGDACQGKNGYLTTGYRGPKPPRGTGAHLYRFKVYVLDTELKLKSSAGKNQLQRAMDGHVLQYGILTGRFGCK